MEPTELQRATPGGAPANVASCPIRTQVRSLFRRRTSGAAPLPRRMTLFRCAGRDEAVGGKQQRARGAEPEPLFAKVEGR